MNQKLTHPEYNEPKDWIAKRRNEGKDWDFIETLGMPNTPLKYILEIKKAADSWPDMTEQDWKDLVQMRKDSETQTIGFSSMSLISGDGTKNGATIPTGSKRSWTCYKDLLLNENHFRKETVDAIEHSTLRILNELSSPTVKGKPKKGLVIGNVQSGKTANMAALMAMAADWGWNMFIILSGTIENLRIQTYERLLHDLNHKNDSWNVIPKPNKSDMTRNSAAYHFELSSDKRYLTVCLKNSTRLKALIQWLQCNRSKYEQMKVLIIDDEADQAGIDTLDESSGRWTAISDRIGNLILGKTEDGRDINEKAKAINYIGYTATPYANILNSGSMKSLYPKDFIATLSVSPEYFGPQQIFGYKGTKYNGLDIVRMIDKADIDDIKAIQQGNLLPMPSSLENAVLWFLCAIAYRRKMGDNDPVSMLIHTSQKTDDHAKIAALVDGWFKNHPLSIIVSSCKALWETETKRFSKTIFRKQYPDYAVEDKALRDYLPFCEIEPELVSLLSLPSPVSHIQIDSKGDTKYHKGIHLCIDNSKNNPRSTNTDHIRLLYPKKNELDYASAFIVIGGATLSRGLTIEGLVSTYFLRTVKQADTLMQMGRWFGYRRNYELIPRIWISDDTKEKFEYLAALDQTLRDEIADMELLGEKPSEYGAKVLLSDNPSMIGITAKNKMQAAVEATSNYKGAYSQTTLFDNDQALLSENLKRTINFVESLGSPADLSNNQHAQPNYVWRNVAISTVKAYLKAFHFNKRQKFFCDIDKVLEWIERNKLNNWNIVVSNLKSTNGGSMHFGFGDVAKVERNRIDSPSAQKDELFIKTLRDPKDLMADIDLTNPHQLTPQEVKEIKDHKTQNVKPIRAKLGLGQTPQLIIYFIDKNSTPSSTNSSGRKPLGALEDVVGLCINIPGERKSNASFVESVSVDLSKVEV